jgi:hypothetical protein
MGPSANVTTTTALIDFRATLCTFADQAKDALGMIDMEIRRAFAFLDEQVHHWTAAVRHAEDKVIQAKTELARRKMMRIGDRPPDTTEQEEELIKARQRLELCEEKLDTTKRWLRNLPEELKEYEGPARRLQGLLEGDLPRMAAYLEQKISALEAYMREPPV